MLPLALFLLSVQGLVTIVTGSQLFAPLRALLTRHTPLLGRLVHCPMCFGFWAGLAAGAVGLWPGGRGLVAVFAAGCAASGWCWGVRVVLARLGEDEL